MGVGLLPGGRAVGEEVASKLVFACTMQACEGYPSNNRGRLTAAASSATPAAWTAALAAEAAEANAVASGAPARAWAKMQREGCLCLTQ